MGKSGGIRISSVIQQYKMSDKPANQQPVKKIHAVEKIPFWANFLSVRSPSARPNKSLIFQIVSG
jgi:hypothetical protein